MSKQLLRRFPKHEVAVGLVFFCKKDRVYASVTARRRDISASSLLRVHTAYVQPHCVIMSVAVTELGCTHAAGFCETWYKNRRCLLSRRTADGVTASRPKHRWWSLHLLAGQCTGSSCTSNSAATSSWNSGIDCNFLTCGRPKGRSSVWLITAFGDWCRSKSTTRQHRMWQIRCRGWWV